MGSGLISILGALQTRPTENMVRSFDEWTPSKRHGKMSPRSYRFPNDMNPRRATTGRDSSILTLVRANAAAIAPTTQATSVAK